MNISSKIKQFLTRHKSPEFKLEAMLFDMDGVLFDSMKNHTLAWYKAFTDLGVPCEQDEFYQYEGATGKWTVNHIFERTYGRKATDEEVEDLYTEKSRYFNELPKAGAMPGAKELLQEVTAQGIIPVLVTGSGQRSLLQRIHQEFPDVFSQKRMVTAFDVRHGKPNPEPYLKGLEKAGAKPAQAMVVENAPLGVKAAVAAGIFTIALNTGPIPDSQLQKAGADLIFPDMLTFAREGFPEILNALQNNAR